MINALTFRCLLINVTEEPAYQWNSKWLVDTEKTYREFFEFCVRVCHTSTHGFETLDDHLPDINHRQVRIIALS